MSVGLSFGYSFRVPMRASTWILGAVLLSTVVFAPGFALPVRAGLVTGSAPLRGVVGVANWTFSCDSITSALSYGSGSTAAWTWLENGSSVPGASYSASCGGGGSQSPPANATGITVRVTLLPACLSPLSSFCRDGQNALTKSLDLTKSFQLKVAANGKGIYLSGLPSLVKYNAKAEFSIVYS